MDKKRPNVEVKYIALPLSIFKNSNVFVKREQRKLACSAERRADERANGEPSLLELF